VYSHSLFLIQWRCAAVVLCLGLSLRLPAAPQGRPPSAEKPAAAASPEPAFTIDLLETHVRFEADGSSHKEVHTRVKIHSEPGAREFGRLAFEYNRSFEQVDIPFVRVSHANGGTTDILSSAIADQPNPTVVNSPAYQDARIKSVRVLGLQPGDTLEYRVVTTGSHHPLAPAFWESHDFASGGTVTKEIYELDLPVSRLDRSAVSDYAPGARADQSNLQLYFSPCAQPASVDDSGKNHDARVIYRWVRQAPGSPCILNEGQTSEKTSSDIEFSTFRNWERLSHAVYVYLRSPEPLPGEVTALSADLVRGAITPPEKLERIYEFVSQKISTIALPVGSTGFRTRPVSEILTAHYATAEDKCALFLALARAAGLGSYAVLARPSLFYGAMVPLPTVFTHVVLYDFATNSWLDPSLEVAPFQMISSNLRGKAGLFVDPWGEIHDARSLGWTKLTKDLPFAASQGVNVDATLAGDGKLTAKVHYTLRGDNELVLRLAFHRAPRDQWKELTQLLALSGGFRGQVSNPVVADPLETREPFTVEYALVQPGFADLAKPSVRVPVPLPQLGLPELPVKSASKAIELGTPLDIEVQLRCQLPPGVVPRLAVPISVRRDYAEFSSSYSLSGNVLVATRRLKFLLREIASGRAADYAAFVRAIQTDEAQEITLERPIQAHLPEAPSAKPR
jgi:Domain of Unknown Function with PDB structure (DUF3857)